METLDTRDLDERKEELETLRDAVTEARDDLNQHRETPRPSDDEEAETWDETEEELKDALEAAEAEYGGDEEKELAELEALESEIGSEFRHGATMIRESDFEEYAQELAEDLCEGFRKQSENWPFACIDWEQAAKELQQDYTSVSFQGEDYFVRC